jgi:diaminohydroxyphosphoribosylaminopyrimidine deaminase/5-amino-6-(5-phosphoribosylamino)uracil reductase
MAEALRLAAMGMNSTHPNPRVGCVIADGQKILGRGYHRAAGEAHAEVNALKDAGDAARGASAYVSLEPCSHHGRTAPCVDALVAAGVKRVVMAMEDPHEVVNGSGRKALEQAGIKVECGLMSSNAEELNPGFLFRIRHGRPYVRIKVAASLDGRTSLANGESKWISSEASRRDVQHWRARASAILTGIGTVLADDPKMTVRLEGQAVQPIRVIADTNWRTPGTSQILSQPGKIIIAGSRNKEIPPGLAAMDIQLLPLPVVEGKLDLHALMAALADEQVNELQVEAGSKLCGALLQQGLVNELLLYQAPVILGEGGAGLFDGLGLSSMQQKVQLQLLESCFLGNDQRLRYKLVSLIKEPG